jgi:hypothetical protein
MGYSHKRNRKGRKGTQRGGNSGASGYVGGLVGTLDQQFNNVFNSPSGGNTVRPLMSGGKRRQKRHRKSQRGGYWAQVINNAIVPLTLFALNKHAHKSRRSGKSRTFRRT